MPTTDHRLGRGAVDMPPVPPAGASAAGLQAAVLVGRHSAALGRAITISGPAALAAGLMVGGIGSS